MPKQKTHRGAAKRFSLTKTGKIKRAKAYRNHIMASKSPKQKRNLRLGDWTAPKPRRSSSLFPINK